MKRQRFHCFIFFAQNTEKLPRLTNNGKSITCTMDHFALLVVPGLSSIPAAVCLQHRDQTDDPVTTRSDKHACGKPMLTDPDKRVTGNHEPAYSFFSEEMYKENPTQDIPDFLQPFTVNLEDLEVCARTFL